MTTTHRPWLQSYPDGVPATIEPQGTLVDLLDGSFHQYASRQAALFLMASYQYIYSTTLKAFQDHLISPVKHWLDARTYINYFYVLISHK